MNTLINSYVAQCVFDQLHYHIQHACTLYNMNIQLYLSMYMYITCSTFTVQDGFSPLYVASEYGHKVIVDILLNNKADPNLTTTVRRRVVCTQ